LKSSAGFT
jgi:hypothetical protein